MTNAETRFNKSLRPRKPESSLGRTAQDVHLDSHTAPELILKLYLAELRRLVVSGINHVTTAEGGCGLCCCYSNSLSPEAFILPSFSRVTWQSEFNDS